MTRESKIRQSIRAGLANFDFLPKSSLQALKSKLYHILQLFWTFFVPEKVATNIFYQNLPNHGQGSKTIEGMEAVLANFVFSGMFPL